MTRGQDTLRVAFLSAEAVPFAKVGGLADVAGALPRELAASGVEVCLVLPGYAAIDRQEHGFQARQAQPGERLEIGRDEEPWRVETARLDGSGVEVLLVSGSAFDRDGIYADPRTGQDYEDQAARWVFFCRAALAALARRGEPIDVLHLNDYHTALVAAYARQPEAAALRSTATVFSVHNLGYQGFFKPHQVPAQGLPPAYFAPLGPLEFWGGVNFMKAGLVLADLLTTVSPTYAREIQSGDEYGHGMQGVLRARAQDLTGILNGIDRSVWDPATDRWIAARYDRDHLEGKLECKRALLERLDLPFEASRPLFGMISRLVTQKGFDLVVEAMPRLLEADVQIVVLGSGQPEYEEALGSFCRTHPHRVSFTRAFDEPLAHAIEAGADFFLMPSRYEPCGLNQMYSLAYGTIPVVRRTGGLADTVSEWDGRRGSGNGFTFGSYTPEALLEAVERALAAFRDPAARHRIVRNGMGEDHSWARAAARYIEVYTRAVAKRRAGLPRPAGD